MISVVLKFGKSLKRLLRVLAMRVDQAFNCSVRTWTWAPVCIQCSRTRLIASRASASTTERRVARLSQRYLDRTAIDENGTVASSSRRIPSAKVKIAAQFADNRFIRVNCIRRRGVSLLLPPLLAPLSAIGMTRRHARLIGIVPGPMGISCTQIGRNRRLDHRAGIRLLRAHPTRSLSASLISILQG